MGVVDGQASNDVAETELGAAGTILDDFANKAVARGEWGFFLHWVSAQAHVDIGAREAGVEGANLDLILWRVWDGGSDDAEVREVAEGGDDDLTRGSRHSEVKWSVEVR